MNRNDEQKMQFILSIRSNGVVDENVLNALETVNRQHFLKGLFAQSCLLYTSPSPRDY